MAARRSAAECPPLKRFSRSSAERGMGDERLERPLVQSSDAVSSEMPSAGDFGADLLSGDDDKVLGLEENTDGAPSGGGGREVVVVVICLIAYRRVVVIRDLCAR